MVDSNTFIRDTIFFIKNDLLTNVTDPISSSRPTNSKFVMTSYPQREAVYPLITLRIQNTSAVRAGMQTDNMDIELSIEVRIWARNVKERDELFTSVFDRLRSIQFTSGGSIDNNLHDFNMPSSVEIDEDGVGIKSKVCEFIYRFYDI